MVFFAGALVGGAFGLGAGMLLQRRAGIRDAHANVFTGRSGATVIALVALVVAAAALARSDRTHKSATPSAPVTGQATTTTASSTTTTTTATASTLGTGLVTVPNVETLSRTEAVNILQRAGLKVSIETLPLANVPTGFVLSQNPLPSAMTAPGSTVTLEVSAAA